MAHMYPRTLLDAEVESAGEKRVFRVVRDGLDEKWDVFHSVSWMIRDPAEGARDGEIDFVLCHPERGIVCLEVKGGGIECQHGEWFRLVDGKRERTKDPFKQALDHRYTLERKVAAVEGWKKRKLFIVHALAFPDITVHELVLAPDAPPEIVIDRNGLKDVPAALDRVLAYHAGAREKRELPGEEGAAMLRELLAAEVRIEVPMAAEFLEEEEQLITLTHEQAALLARFGRDPRMVITGCAGSGKTMLAVERAKRLAAEGADVLFVCFNRKLRDHLREREGRSGVKFHTFHGLCVELASRAGVELTRYPLGRGAGVLLGRGAPQCSRRRERGTLPQRVRISPVVESGRRRGRAVRRGRRDRHDAHHGEDQAHRPGALSLSICSRSSLDIPS
jgi:hypothetical protein